MRARNSVCLKVLTAILIAVSFFHGTRKPTLINSGTTHWKDIDDTGIVARQVPPRLPAVVVILKRTGIGSQLLNLFASVIYYREHENRNLIVDETTYHYRLSASVGLMEGYFTPKLPVIQSATRMREWVEPHFLPERNYTEWRYTAPSTDQWDNRDNSSPMIVMNCIATRRHTKEAFDRHSLGFYQKMKNEMCPSLQFNSRTRTRIAEFQGSRNIPLFGSDNKSAAFHIRRGDKLHSESKKYHGEEYLEKLEQVAPGVSFQNCFVATDSYKAFLEVQESLETQQWKTCRTLWTLTQPSERGHFERSRVVKEEAVLQFLSELDILTRATYFVGTFGSNVGALAAVLRGCDSHYDGSSHPYAQSYGLDSDHWFMR